MFEQPYKRAKFEVSVVVLCFSCSWFCFQNDIKEAAKELLDCIGRWEGNELLNIAKEVALQIQEIQILLGYVCGLVSATILLE